MARHEQSPIAEASDARAPEAASEAASGPASDSSPGLAPATTSELTRLMAERDALVDQVVRLQQRLAEVELLADRDPLTPVLNRRAFMRELQRASAFCSRYGAPASLVFFDLDQFKAVNDLFGHAAGDAALATVAQLLVDHVRETDVVGRLGGDEFAVLLTQTEQPAAEAKTASLKAMIESRPLVHGGVEIPLRISAGVRAFPPGATPATWLAEADAAMFVRKAGR